ncbi:hypothetical protein [Streptomyces odontomachi]|uniref:hypothetical protein n=1 Tax=Streptomyces odontomachi TaxID=2944940 RepID=UPI00210BEDEE|nr:hypothetical protein [Streptomyces sp. ODS25]
MEIPILVACFFVFAFAGFGGIESKVRRADRRVARLERKIDLIAEHLGVQTDSPELEKVTALVREGKKIQAIRAYREITGAGLREASLEVERLA